MIISPSNLTTHNYVRFQSDLLFGMCQLYVHMIKPITNGTVVYKCVDRVDSRENEPTVQAEEGNTKLHQVESIEQLTAEHVQAFQELANRPMPPLPAHFLKSVK